MLEDFSSLIYCFDIVPRYSAPSNYTEHFHLSETCYKCLPSFKMVIRFPRGHSV